MKLTDMVPWFCGTCHRPLVKIRIDDADGGLQTCEIDALPKTIGRSEEADIRLADHWVSKVHCCLISVDGCLFVRDLESRNGTAVNRDLVDEQQLEVGDTISIGRSGIEVLYIAGRKRLLNANPPSESTSSNA